MVPQLANYQSIGEPEQGITDVQLNRFPGYQINKINRDMLAETTYMYSIRNLCSLKPLCMLKVQNKMFDNICITVR